MFNCREELTAAEITAEEAKVAEEEAREAAWAAAEENEAREVDALREIDGQVPEEAEYYAERGECWEREWEEVRL
jgi:hypothetical protein